MTTKISFFMRAQRVWRFTFYRIVRLTGSTETARIVANAALRNVVVR